MNSMVQTAIDKIDEVRQEIMRLESAANAVEAVGQVMHKEYKIFFQGAIDPTDVNRGVMAMTIASGNVGEHMRLILRELGKHGYSHKGQVSDLPKMNARLYDCGDIKIMMLNGSETCKYVKTGTKVVDEFELVCTEDHGKSTQDMVEELGQ